MEYKSNYELIISKIRSVRSKEAILLLISAILMVFSIVLLVMFLVSLVESFSFGDQKFRFLLALLIFVAILVPSFMFVYPAVLRWLGIKNSPNDIAIARRVGNVYEEINDKLSNSIELINELEVTNTSKELSIASFNNIAEVAKSKDFDVIIDKEKPKKRLILFLIILLLTGLSFTLFNNSLGAALVRVVNFNKSYVPPAPFSLHIEQEKGSVLKGSKVKITVKSTGTAPMEVKLKIREFNQENFDEYNLNIDSGDIYTYEIPAVKNSIYFYASSPWMNSEVKSKQCTLFVVDRPIVKYFDGTLIYPSYTLLPSKKFNEQSADISAIRGSSINLNISSNKELESASIIFSKSLGLLDSSKSNHKSDSIEYKMKVSGKSASGGFTLTSNGQYYIKLKSKDGLNNENPIKHNVYLISDEYPSISLIEPIGEAQVGEDALLPMQVAISDDYGFSGLKLFYRIIESKYVEPEKNYSSISIPFSQSDLTAQVPYMWDMNKIGISPEDVYEFYFEVYDNDRISGPKSARTNLSTVRLPSLDEVLREADKMHDNIEKELENVLKEMQEVKKESDELNRELLKSMNNKQQMSWDQKKKADEIAKKQDEIQNKVSDIEKNLQEVTDKLNNNNLISQETLQKYMDLQKLLREVKSPELQRYNEQLKKALDNMTPQQMQEAMKNFKFDEEKFKQSIERTMKMLQRIQNEQKIDALNKKAEEMINKLDELNKQMKNSNSSDEKNRKDLSQKQEKLKDNLNSLKKDLNDLEKSLEEMGIDNPKDQMKNAKEQLNSEQTMQEMNKSQQNMQNGDFSEANQNQQQAKSNLQKFMESMQNMKQSMQNNMIQESIRKMQKATNDLNQLSKNQENIKKRTENIDPNSMQFKDITSQQAENLAAMNNVVSQLVELSQKSFAVTPEMAQDLSNAMQNMQKSIQQMTDRNSSNASKSQQQAMSNMNNAMSQMQQMVSQMKKTGSCSNPGGSGEGQSGQGAGGQGMMQKLQQLAAQQQAINQAMQQMGMGQGGGSMTREQQAKADRLSNQQGNAKKTLEDLENEQKQFSGGKRKPLGDLDKIAQEMQEVINDIKSGNISPETQKKQNRILSRLLDANKSATEKDFEKKRKSNSGQDVFRISPDEFDMSTQEGKSAMMKEFLRSIQSGYNKDYEILIKQYFEQIK